MGGLERIYMVQDENSWQAVLTAVMKFSNFIKCGESLKQLRNCLLFKKSPLHSVI
jgi:hypothetical protein